MKGYRNRFDWSGECAARGLNAEEFFVVKANEHGYDVKKAGKEDDMFRKIDFYFRKSKIFHSDAPDAGKIYTTDVKAMKKISRQDAEPQDQWTWIELHGVNAGNKGWLYGGQSDFISFQTRRGFLLIPRVDLITKVEELVDTTARVRTPDEAPYKIYQRAGRLDEVTLIEKKHLLGIAWEEWK
jgi:hypothetical protein